MRAFIIRPFGKKKDGKGNEIDFDKVANELISPALAAVGAEGRETLDIVQSGNIRVDMFRRLLTADLVVADLSIHNANVFYELGIRHALRDHGTLMLRSDGDAFPFDLQTDRYLTYDRADPKASLPQLIHSLQAIKNEAVKSYTVKDSPVFASLPKLTEPDPSQFNPIPQDFGEDVERAVAGKQAGDLALLSYEVRGLEWELQGLRTVGAAQFNIKSLAGAKLTWENVLALDPLDLEANIRLGTIYERLDDLVQSTQALERALLNPAISPNQRAEAHSLIGRNFKTHWRDEWESRPPEERAAAALRSPYLQNAFKNYKSAFEQDLDHFYSGLNALAMLKIMLALAQLLPDVWAEQFLNDKKAAAQLEEYEDLAPMLVAAVQLSLDATFKRFECTEQRDVWADISQADLLYITTKAPARVAAAYRRAVVMAPDFVVGSITNQLAIYRDLGVLTDNLAEVLNALGAPPQGTAPQAETMARKRVLVFAGHMIDEPNRETKRFPADKEDVAREKIKEAILHEVNSGPGVAAGYAGGASGGDILFHEVCAELGIPTRLYLAVPPQIYVTLSVDEAGPDWVARFWRLYAEHAERKQVRVLSKATEAGDSLQYLPAWLRDKPKYRIWQRNNLWMLFNALAESCDEKSGDPNLTMIALWDGVGSDGPGGTEDLVEKVQALGARCEIINTKEAFGLT